MLKLKFDDGKEYSFSQSQIIVGRIDSCDLIIAHESISRNHAKIIKDAQGNYCLGDLGSANGTYINNEELSADNFYRIENGDKLGFGDIDIEAVLLNKNVSDSIPSSVIQESDDFHNQDISNQAPISVQDLLSISDIGQNKFSNNSSNENDDYLDQNENYNSGQYAEQNSSNNQQNNYVNQSMFGYSESSDMPRQKSIGNATSDSSNEIPNLDELQEKLNALKEKTQASTAAAPLGLNLFAGLVKSKNDKGDKKVKKELSEEEFLQQMGFADLPSDNDSQGLVNEPDTSNSFKGLFGKSSSNSQVNKNNFKQIPDEINEEDLLKQFESFSAKTPLPEALVHQNLNAFNEAETNSGLINQLLAEQSATPLQNPVQIPFPKPISQNLQTQTPLDNTKNNSHHGTLSQETLQELASKLKNGTRSSGEADQQSNNFGKISQALKSNLFGKK
jgi:pSer/pThr/pTyr-binding forkhead associated (FHA) protein